MNKTKKMFISKSLPIPIMNKTKKTLISKSVPIPRNFLKSESIPPIPLEILVSNKPLSVSPLSPNGIEERTNIRTIIREKLFDNENNPYSTQNRRNTEENMRQERIQKKELEKELEKEFILENEDREEKKLKKIQKRINKKIETLKNNKRSRSLRRNNYKSKGGKTRRHKIRVRIPVKFSR